MTTILILMLGYILVLLGFWRTLTGHFAWEVHRSSSNANQKTVRPPVDNWFWCALPSLVLAGIWPITLLFIIPWPWKIGAEKKAEADLGRLQYQALVESNKQAEMHLQLGEHAGDEPWELP